MCDLGVGDRGICVGESWGGDLRRKLEAWRPVLEKGKFSLAVVRLVRCIRDGLTCGVWESSWSFWATS